MTREEEQRLTTELQRLTALADQGANLSGTELEAHTNVMQALADSLEAAIPALQEGGQASEALREAAVHAMAANRKAIKVQHLRFKLADLSSRVSDPSSSQRVDLIS